jgi:hypothetical protein
MTRRTPLLATLLIPTLALGSGCDLLSQLQQRTGIVDVFAGSHGTPDEAGNLPSRNGQQLIFVNDMGWDVFINEAYITTSAVTLAACDGERFDVELYWGPLAEDVGETADTQSSGLGGVRADSGNYCELLVEFAPTAETAPTAEATGSTVFLKGTALKGEERVDFLWSTDIEVAVTVDISEVEAGGPFHISKDQNFSKKLTVSKGYDQFFVGIDFADELSQGDIDALIAATLTEETIAKVGK